MNTYKLSKDWFEFCYANPEKIKPIHTSVYFFAIDTCNRLGWKEKFGLPTDMVKEALGIGSYNTYKKALNDLIDWQFIEMVQKSQNQYTANIITLKKVNSNIVQSTLGKTISNRNQEQQIPLDTVESSTVDNEFLKQVCDFFSQTTRTLKRKVKGYLDLLEQRNQLENFKKQTLAYIEYKNLTKERVHSWTTYRKEWSTTDWIHKLDKAGRNDDKPSTTVTKTQEIIETNAIAKQMIRNEFSGHT